MLSVINGPFMLSVGLLNVIMLSVVAPRKKVMRSLSLFFQLCDATFAKLIKINLRLFIRRGYLNYRIGATTLGITSLSIMTFSKTTISITARKCYT